MPNLGIRPLLLGIRSLLLGVLQLILGIQSLLRVRSLLLGVGRQRETTPALPESRGNANYSSANATRTPQAVLIGEQDETNVVLHILIHIVSMRTFIDRFCTSVYTHMLRDIYTHVFSICAHIRPVEQQRSRSCSPFLGNRWRLPRLSTRPSRTSHASSNKLIYPSSLPRMPRERLSVFAQCAP